MNIQNITKKIIVEAFIESDTEEGKFYKVRVDTENYTDSCTCKGYKYHQSCKHIDALYKRVENF